MSKLPNDSKLSLVEMQLPEKYKENFDLVFPNTHVFFCLLYKGQSLKSDNFYRKAKIEKR